MTMNSALWFAQFTADTAMDFSWCLHIHQLFILNLRGFCVLYFLLFFLLFIFCVF